MSDRSDASDRIPRPERHEFSADPYDPISCRRCGMPFAFGALHVETNPPRPEMPEERGYLSFQCPFCFTPAGVPCRSRNPYFKGPHRERLELVMRQEQQRWEAS